MSHLPHGRLAGQFRKAFVQALKAAGESPAPALSGDYAPARTTRTLAAVRRFTTTD